MKFRMFLRLISLAAALSLPRLGFHGDTVNAVRFAIFVAIALSFFLELGRA